MWAARGCRQRVGWRGPRGLRERKGSIQHKDVPDTDGKAGPGKKPAPPTVQQADGENILQFPARWAYRPSAIHRSTGGSSAIRARWLEYRVLKPTRRGEKGREDHCREERGRWQISCFFQQRDIYRKTRKKSTVVTRHGFLQHT